MHAEYTLEAIQHGRFDRNYSQEALRTAHCSNQIRVQMSAKIKQGICEGIRIELAIHCEIHWTSGLLDVNLCALIDYP